MMFSPSPPQFCNPRDQEKKERTLMQGMYVQEEILQGESNFNYVKEKVFLG